MTRHHGIAIEAQIWNVQCWMVNGGAVARASMLHATASGKRISAAATSRSQVVAGNTAAGTVNGEA